MNNLKNKQTIILLLVAVLVVFACVAAYVMISHKSVWQSTLSGQSSPQVTADSNAMMAKIRMEMSKDQVNQAIGQPYSCAQSQPSMAGDKKYVLEHCSYGDKNAPKYVDVIYMEGKVWGASVTVNPDRQ